MSFQIYDNVKATERFNYAKAQVQQGDHVVEVPLFVEIGDTGHVTAAYGDFRVLFDGHPIEVAIPKSMVELWPEGPNRNPHV